jgi:hypothetical protein
VAVEALGDRRDFFSCKAPRRVARHLDDVADDPGVVGPPRPDHLAADLAEARLVLGGADRTPRLGRAERT